MAKLSGFFLRKGFLTPSLEKNRAKNKYLEAFGPKKLQSRANPEMKKFLLIFLLLSSFLQSAPIAYFSKKDQIAEELVSRISLEQKTIRMAIFSLNHRKIIKALLEAHKRGVSVELLVDPSSIRAGSSLMPLAEAGIPVLVFHPVIQGKKRPLMHHKFCLFGDKSLWTGSFNCTLAADRLNRENALLIDDKELALQYLTEFKALKSESISIKQIEEKRMAR